VTFTCDFCGAAIDTSSDASLIIGVHRRIDADDWDSDLDELYSGDHRVFRYCSQQHLASHMERVPLPPVHIDHNTPTGAVAGCVAASIIGITFVALAVYGAIQFWHDVVR